MIGTTFTDDNFFSDVLEKSKTKPVLVDFFATWCGPCKAQTPILGEIEKEMDGKAVIGSLDVDDNPQTPQSYEVMGIPSLLIFRNGEVAERFTGLQQRKTLTDALEKHI